MTKGNNPIGSVGKILLKGLKTVAVFKIRLRQSRQKIIFICQTTEDLVRQGMTVRGVEIAEGRAVISGLKRYRSISY
ncbi:MAG: hypothetical protein IJT16_01820 [Lachnospiraceae bacterium]|nr:hypothetical protein [Lachnospiraceae bacterium]